MNAKAANATKLRKSDKAPASPKRAPKTPTPVEMERDPESEMDHDPESEMVYPVAPPAPIVPPAPVVPVRPSDPVRAPSRRLTETEVITRLGSVAVNVDQNGTITVKVQGFVDLDVGLAFNMRQRPDESRTDTLERLLRVAFATDGLGIPEVTAEVMAAVGRAHATKPISPSERARRDAAPAKRTLVTL